MQLTHPEPAKKAGSTPNAAYIPGNPLRDCQKSRLGRQNAAHALRDYQKGRLNSKYRLHPRKSTTRLPKKQAQEAKPTHAP
ncbi:hypothetical protein BC351_04445 [Paenibacillus ferrarius]|uniref:Uncharacterized protein n=1 Tax=Paenibacillus ferrarius TaxID=1469647 RepID=A0A1V4HM39_9BACL|nr:hypothetical protein BC351_04445 [Paenibacillus ferrarius]